jgi:uncharacterized low-complexity protein
MAKKSLKPVAAAVGAAFAGSMMLSGTAAAEGNPFGMTELNAGYMQLASSHEGKCGAGKCGGSTEKTSEGKCGAGKCGGSAEKSSEGKCGGSTEKSTEGKCGAGKCGGSAEKSTEGKCGAGKCGGSK